ncbi:MAG: ornithine cyclodeaminase [Herminiimonas sp.]|nr:ornithine cyclodeaminase [Herminiimonas sp.]
MALFLTEQDIKSLLTMPMAIEAVETVMAEVARGEAVNMPRERVRSRSTTQHLLQGQVPSHQAIGYKVYTVSKGVVRFLLHVYDAGDGRLNGILEARLLGMMRTGAASGVATKYLATRHASVLGVFGSGRQAVGQIEAVCQVRPIKEVKVFSRNKDKLATFCHEMSARFGVTVRAAASAEETVRDSDIITTITSSDTPLFEGAWLKPGAHINAAGANALSRREIDETALERCSLIVTDSRAVAEKECGDLLPLLEKGKLGWGQISELGDVIIGRAPARAADDQITCYESHGLAVQDLIVGARLLALARAGGIGVELPISI